MDSGYSHLAVDHARRLRSENSSTNLVQGLQQRVCSVYIPFSELCLYFEELVSLYMFTRSFLFVCSRPCCEQFLGACSRGLTCPYQHDPSKIAICWKFLQDNCSNSAETCHLSHDPTPERTPLCVHFLNKGRCTREKCPFPHVKVGQRQGVCRDFAVLGYCERGLDCDHQHVRECPDFAEKGACETRGCKLPHVIRANRNRKMDSGNAEGEKGGKEVVTAEEGQLGDEFISLTFRESDSEDDEDDEGDEESDEEMGDEDVIR
jgi:hypothetical protein